jgi:hypothetical protein
LKYIKIGIVYLVLILPLIYLVWPLIVNSNVQMYSPTIWKEVPLYIGNALIFLCYSLTYPYLMYLMNKLHKFEFERLKANTTVFFVLMLAIVFMNIAFLFIVKRKDIGTST